MSTNKEDRSFKTLINRETTDSANKFFFNELGADTINVHSDDIWAETIPHDDPTAGIAIGRVEERVLFVMTEDLSVPNSQAWKAHDTPGDANSARLRDWISDKYGAGYSLKLYDNNDNEIFTTDPVGWFFDTQTGILTFDGNALSKARPFKVSGYRYIGKKGAGSGGGGGGQVTEEDFTISVDLVGGVDPIGLDTITNQAEATAAGSFKTIPAAVDALPEILAHTVTIEIADADEVLTGDFLGNFERFVPRPTPEVGQGNFTAGGIVIQPASGLVLVGGTVPMNVASQTTPRIIQLTSNPTLGDNAFRGYMLRVASGTGAGQVRAIYEHSDIGQDFRTCGAWNPALDNTSVVEIVEPAVRLKTNPNAYGYPGLRGPHIWFEYVPFLTLKNLHLWSDPADGIGYLAPEKINVLFEDCMMKVFGMYGVNAFIWTHGGSWDGGNQTASFWESLIGGRELYLEIAYNDARGCLLYDAGSHGIAVGFPGEPGASGGTYSGLVFYNIGGDAVRSGSSGTEMAEAGGFQGGASEGFNVAGFGLHAQNGGAIFINDDPAKQLLTGALGDIGLDQEALTYEELIADPHKHAEGPRGGKATAGNGFPYFYLVA